MSVNLLETIQKNLGYPALQKIDPNTQEVTVNDKTPDEHKFSQAAIPAILIALYKYTTRDDAAENVLRGNTSTNWVAGIFGEVETEFIGKIVAYSGLSAENASIKLNAIASEAVRLIRENVPGTATAADVKKFIAHQRNNVLPFLPTAIHMGELVNDTTIDDNTNKMEGPISSLMQAIGGQFSEPVTGETTEKNK